MNLGRVDTKAGKLQAVYRYLDPETKMWKTLVGTINPEDKSIDNDDPRLLKGNNSNMMLWIGLLAASGAGAVGMTLYSRKKKEQNI